jgi:hypothetical protein
MPISVNTSFLKNPTATESGVLGVKILPSPSVVISAKPTNVAFAIDASGSMEGDRIDSVKLTLKVVVGMLKPQDKITLVAFAQNAITVLNQFVIVDDSEAAKATALAAIDTLEAGGGTNLESGIFMLGNLYKNQPAPDALVVLTDGHINEGITSFSGLNTILGTYFATVPMYTLGYGSDHNAELLKRLAENSRANYTHIKEELSLPIAMGDLYGGLRSEVATKAVLTYPSTWQCLEPLADDKGTYVLGSLVAEKAMWAMFSVPASASAMSVVLTYEETGVGPGSITSVVDNSLSKDEIEEQYLRCLMAKVFNDVAGFIKNRQLSKAETALKAAIKLIDDSSVATNPFVVRMKAQLAETLDQTTRAAQAPPHAHFGAANDLFYRTTSVGGNYTAQRGRTQMADGATPSLFSTQEQDVTSAHMVDIYSAGGSAHPPADPAPVV